MAKRRKQYRGTPEQHAGRARETAVALRQELKQARRSLAAGRCAGALHKLRIAEWFAGSFAADTANDVRRGRIVGGRVRGGIRGMALNRALSGTWTRFFSKCVK